ncbi:MAG: M48 family metallopeptidase [Pseudomonadota bacterium]
MSLSPSFFMIPINTFMTGFLAVYLFMATLDTVLELLNVSHLKKRGGSVPDGFAHLLDPEKLKQMQDYSLAQTKLGLVETCVGRIVFLGVILSGLIPGFQDMLANLPFIPGGLLFFAVLGFAAALFDLPFEWYRIFSIEERFGFNTRTLGLWLRDLLKSLLLSLVLGGGLLALLLLVILHAGRSWWIWAWVVFFSFQFLVIVLYPTLIAPLFNKFTPMGDHPLAGKIRDLVEREGLRVKGIFQMDAGKRSRHTNAYLAGLGKTRRIVLFDTLMKAHGDEEILAVLAHEIGHLKKHHMVKQLVLTGAVSALLLYLASTIMAWRGMYESFGFSSETAYVGLLLVGILWGLVAFFLSPLAMALSRRFEKEADQYASKVMGGPVALIGALKKMVLDNLSNLFPHPLYVVFHYSHPPVPERIRLLGR